MHPLSTTVSPFIVQLEVQLSFLNGLSKSIFRTVQQYGDLHIQLAQALLEESSLASQQAITALAAHVQPAAEKLHAYQQQLSRIAADIEVELSDAVQHYTAPAPSQSGKQAPARKEA